MEFLVGLLHHKHDMIPDDFPWRFLARDELTAAEAAWLADHPGWKTRVQKGPPQGATESSAAADISCCSGGVCTPADASSIRQGESMA